jgi:replicative DNA helicase
MSDNASSGGKSGPRKPYPFDQPFQRAVLQMMLRDPTFVPDLFDALDSRYFEFEYLSLIGKILLAHYKKYRELPSRSVMIANVNHHVTKHGLDALLRQQMVDFLDHAYRTDLPQDRRYYREQVADFGRMQALKEGIAGAVALLQEHPDDAAQHSKVLPLIQRALQVGSGTGPGIEIFSNAEDPAKLRSPIDDPGKRVPTMFHDLDNAMRGGLGGGQLGVVLGVTGRGKSMMLVNLAVAAAMQGRRVVYITNELQPYDVGMRALACVTRCSIADVEANSPAYQDARRAISFELAGRLFLWHINPGSPVSTVRTIVSRLQFDIGVPPDLIVVDYADELTPTRMASRDADGEYNSYNSFGDVYSELISIAKDFKCPMWTASQVQRSAYSDEVVGMGSVSDSVKKIQKAHVVASLCQNQTEREQGRMRLWVDKVRNGPDQFAVELTVDLSRCLMRQRGPDPFAVASDPPTDNGVDQPEIVE